MNEKSGPAPVYLFAGGPGSRSGDGDPVLARAIESCGVSRPTIAYIGAASGDDKRFFSMLSGYLRSNGAGEVVLAPTAGKRIKLEKTKAVLESAHLVLVSGGDVEEGMEIVEERKLLPFLRELFDAGKPFLGISAGSIMLASQWVVWDNPADDTTASVFPCMGFAPVLCDTHGESEGWEELRALLKLTPEGTLGYGIPAGAALCVHPDGAPEALGGPVHCLARFGGRIVRGADLEPR